ncbi:MAG: rhodanese-like domain-containing protein [Planctomycetes bacterium]|nr:rhodanese-like domain-containing protein [Planctomycetota bacterium]
MNLKVVIIYIVLSGFLLLYLLHRWMRMHGTESIGPDEIESYLAKDPVLLDVRTERERSQSPVPGAQGLPHNEVANYPFTPGRPILTFCISGVRAYKAAQTLGKSGQEVAYFTGSHRDLAAILVKRAQN